MRERLNIRHNAEFVVREPFPVGEHLLFPETGEKAALRKPSTLESPTRRNEESHGAGNGRAASQKVQDLETSGGFLDRFVREQLGFNRETRNQINNIIQMERVRSYCERIKIDKRHAELCSMVPSERDMGELEQLKDRLVETRLLWAKRVGDALGTRLKANILGREDKIRDEVSKLWLKSGSELDGRDIDNLFVLAVALGHENPVSFKKLLDIRAAHGRCHGPSIDMYAIVGIDGVTEVLKDAFNSEIKFLQAKERSQTLLWSEWKTPLWIESSPNDNTRNGNAGRFQREEFEPAFLHLVAYAARKIGFEKASVRIERGEFVLSTAVALDLG